MLEAADGVSMYRLSVIGCRCVTDPRQAAAVVTVAVVVFVLIPDRRAAVVVVVFTADADEDIGVIGRAD